MRPTSHKAMDPTAQHTSKNTTMPAIMVRSGGPAAELESPVPPSVDSLSVGFAFAGRITAPRHWEPKSTGNLSQNEKKRCSSMEGGKSKTS